MKFNNAINWAKTWLALNLLKASTGKRLSGDNEQWLQPVRSNKPAIVNRVDFLLEYCAGKKVLHAGFTDHPYTAARIRSGELFHNRLKNITTDLAGIDIEVDAIETYKTITKDQQVYPANIMAAYPPEAIHFEPQVILISEVLEHLDNPYQAVDILYNSFPAGTMVLVTVPNYTSLDSIAASLHHTESIHPHHHWYFSPYTLQRLFDAGRFRLHQLHFGMYYQPHTRINAVLKHYPFNGDCIIGLFTIIKTTADG